MNAKNLLGTILFFALVLVCFSPSVASDQEGAATPAEKSDVQSIDQVIGESSSEGGATPIEESDIKSIDQVNEEGSLDEDSDFREEKEDK